MWGINCSIDRLLCFVRVNSGQDPTFHRSHVQRIIFICHKISRVASLPTSTSTTPPQQEALLLLTTGIMENMALVFTVGVYISTKRLHGTSWKHSSINQSVDRSILGPFHLTDNTHIQNSHRELHK